jgi:hypothetical protein
VPVTGPGSDRTKASCGDGSCGQLRRVVVDPVGRIPTHLVVEAPYGHTTGRLVPVSLVESAAGAIGLGMSTDLGSQEAATDGDIGRVRGLVVNPEGDHVTHVLLDEGHLWGRKQIAIPISAVQSVEHGVRLDLSKDEVRDLSPIDVRA